MKIDAIAKDLARMSASCSAVDGGETVLGWVGAVEPTPITIILMLSYNARNEVYRRTFYPLILGYIPHSLYMCNRSISGGRSDFRSN